MKKNDTTKKFDTPDIEILLKDYDKCDSVALSTFAVSESDFDIRIRQLGIDDHKCHDWSDEALIQIPEPKCAYLNISGIDRLPESKDEMLKAHVLFCDAQGNFLSKFVVEGGEVPLQNQNGDIIQATVEKITATEVICDVNHPLAGMTLHFVGSIQEVREATEQDKLAYMRQMTGQFETGGCGGGCHGGGCHGGGCGGNCEGCGDGNCGGNCGGDCHCK